MHSSYLAKFNCLFLFTFGLLAIACNADQTDGLISYPQAELLTSDNRASAILKDYDIIPLDTASDAVLSYITKIKFDEGLYFVLEKGTANKLAVFNRAGAYVGQIPPAPEGTNPLRDLADFTLDTARNQILILDGQTKKVLAYDYTLQLANEMQLDFYAYALEYHQNLMLFATANEDHALYITDEKGQLIAKHFVDDKGERVRMFQPFDPNPTQVLYNHWEDDIIYAIDGSGTVSEYVTVDFPTTGASRPGSNVRSAHEVNGTLVLSFQLPEIGLAVLLHQSGSKKSVRFTELDNDVTYTRHFLLPVVGKQDNYLISYLPAEYLAQAARNTAGQRRNERFEAVAKEITPASNAVLLLYHPQLE